LQDGDQNFSEHSSRPKSYASKTDEEEIVKKGCDSREHRSFRDMVLGDGETEEKADHDTNFEDEDIEEEDGSGIKVKEQTIGQYECLEFILSLVEEHKIYMPWKHGVIVKLLGRKIGYKAPETSCG
jgi:hypothetical protein